MVVFNKPDFLLVKNTYSFFEIYLPTSAEVLGALTNVSHLLVCALKGSGCKGTVQ